MSEFLSELDMLGVPLFLLRNKTGGPIKGKWAAPAGWQNRTAEQNADVLDAWRPGRAVGMLTGHVLDTIDVDPRHGGSDSLAQMAHDGLVPTVHKAVRTLSGGFHLHVPLLGMKNAAGLMPGIDLRTRGGFVLVPPTEGYHALSRSEWPELGAQPADAIERLRALARGDAPLRERETARGPVTPQEAEKASNVLERALRDTRGAHGARNNTVSRWLLVLYSFVKAGALGRDDVEDRLWEAVQEAPGDHLYTREEFDASRESAWGAARAERPRVDDPASDFGMVRDESAAEGANGWTPVDLSAYLDGTYAPPQATLMCRTDGVGLLYPGMTHSIHGESESGKSMIVQAQVAKLLEAGCWVLLLDYEADPGSVVERLRLMGVSDEQLARLVYVQPEVDHGQSEVTLEAFEALLSRAYTLAVIDGVTEALAQAPAKVRSTGGLGGNDDITVWHDRLPRVIARRTGAAVVLLDHVAKGPDAGRFAIGGQAKMATISGAAYLVRPRSPLGRGLRGEVDLYVAKDRHGYVRSKAGEYTKDRLQLVATAVVDGRDGLSVELRAPVTGPTEDDRLADMMQRVSEFLSTLGDEHPGATLNLIKGEVVGNNDLKARAVHRLVERGNVSRTVKGQSSLHHNLRPYVAGFDQEPEP